MNKDQLIQILKENNLWTKKALGQNFLIDDQVLEKINKAAKITPKDYVIEVGPGLGVLTKELCKQAKKVTTIEIDKTLIPYLEKTLSSYKNLEIINQDALKTPPPTSAYKVVANIPYYITSPLINHFLAGENKAQSITMLVQKELAQKLVKTEPKMSILSLQVALFGKAELVSIVDHTAFHPAPKVDSAIIHITKSDNPVPPETAQKILRLAKTAFSCKRKKLRNTIGQILKDPKIDLNRRPENLSIDEWRELI